MSKRIKRPRYRTDHVVATLRGSFSGGRGWTLSEALAFVGEPRSDGYRMADHPETYGQITIYRVDRLVTKARRQPVMGPQRKRRLP